MVQPEEVAEWIPVRLVMPEKRKADRQTRRLHQPSEVLSGRDDELLGLIGPSAHRLLAHQGLVVDGGLVRLPHGVADEVRVRIVFVQPAIRVNVVDPRVVEESQDLSLKRRWKKGNHGFRHE